MCCFCQEGIAYKIACDITKTGNWNPEDEQSYFFPIALIMENENLLSSAIKYEQNLTDELEQIKQQNFNMTDLHGVLTRAAFCQIIEILVKKGFDSNEYQSILTKSFISNIIKTYKSLKPLVPDNRLFLHQNSLADIFLGDFLLTKSNSEEIINSPEIAKDCEEFLTRYIDWWCYEQDDKEFDVNEFKYVEMYFPYIYFSFLMVERFDPNSILFSRMVTKTPASFGASLQNLWLQRKAALALYNTMGLQAFLPYKEEGALRSTLIYYLVVKQKLTRQEEDTLRNSILQSGRYKPNEDISFAKKRNLIYLALEYYIIEELDNKHS